LILTNVPLCVCNVSVEEPFVNCDHNQVVFSLFSLFTHSDGPSDDQHTASVAYDWEKADFSKFAECLTNVDWLSVVHTNLTPDDLWSAFCEVLHSIADVCVPMKQVIPSKKNTSTKHYPYSIQRAAARKCMLWRQSQVDPTEAMMKEAYRLSVQKYRLLVRRYEIKKEQKIIEANNMGDFYKFINKKLSCKVGIGALRDEARKILTTDIERAMALNEYFASAGVADNGIAPHMPSRVQPGVSLSGVVFTEAKVRAAIKKLKNNTASGVDGWPPLLFKKLINSLAHPLAILFQSFFSVGKIPVQWKQAIITPVYKSGSSSEMNNYRPISLTCSKQINGTWCCC